MAMTGFNHSVTWGEFRTVGSRPSGSEDAYIKADKSVTYSYSTSGSGASVTSVNGSIRVNRAESWKVRGRESSSLLKHEQGHFDITALGMREEYDRTASLTGSSPGDLRTQYEAINRDVNTKVAAANRRYDRQTDHSRNAAAQRRWNTAIANAKRSSTGTVDDLPS